MDISQQAINWVQGYYAGRAELRTHDKEFGCLFWTDGSAFLPDEMVWSPDYAQVKLYPPAKRLQIIQRYAKKVPEQYFGDFHSHPASLTWAGQIPSPDDLFNGAVAGDHWEVVLPDGRTTSLPLKPGVQIILLLMFGDLLVMSPAPGRTPYPNIEVQKGDLAQRQKTYCSYHRRMDRRLRQVGKDIDHTAYLQILGDEVAEINKILEGRVVLHVVKAGGSLFRARNVIGAVYGAIWKDWFGVNAAHMPAKIEVLADDGEDGYSEKENRLVLHLSEVNLEEAAACQIAPLPAEPGNWLGWQVSLVHEMLHEYQHKALGHQSTPAGNALQATEIKSWSGTGHSASFYAAIADRAAYFGLAPERLCIRV